MPAQTLSALRCALCLDSGGRVIWCDEGWRIVAADDPDFPIYYRVIAQNHVREFTDLPTEERVRCMEVVAAVESALIAHAHPDKVNVASLGNVVPHLHWHVIARFKWDSHFPEPIWGTRMRSVKPSAAIRLDQLRASLDEAVGSLAAQTGLAN